MKHLILVLIALGFAFLSACIKEDTYEIPEIEILAITIDSDKVITIRALSNLYDQELQQHANNIGIDPTDLNAINTLRQTFKFSLFESTNYIEGYVISTDYSGNFFEELIIQDLPKDPNSGIKILIDSNPLYARYQFGRKVFVKLDGLNIGYNSGVLTLGILNGNNLDKIAESQQTEYLVRDSVVAEIEPRLIEITNFSVSETNLFIRLEDVQFNRYDALGENRKTFAAEPYDEFDGERLLEECGNGHGTIFSTSAFADFKARLLPDGRGSLDGILTMNYFGDVFNIVVNDPSTIYFDNTDRCDPTEIDCGITSSNGGNVLFEESFENQVQNEPISGNGWTNFAEAGTVSWEAFFSDSGNISLGVSARVGSYDSGDSRSISWLISPRFNFDTQEDETLNFKTSNSFADGSRLELLFSNNWDGDTENIGSASWDLLVAAYIVQDEDNFANWFPSGNIDLSCVTGEGYLAWKYVGSGNPAFDGTYELDDIEIRAY